VTIRNDIYQKNVLEKKVYFFLNKIYFKNETILMKMQMSTSTNVEIDQHLKIELKRVELN
jgi:hypothetical protein